jgi:hypothetical protein
MFLEALIPKIQENILNLDQTNKNTTKTTKQPEP